MQYVMGTENIENEEKEGEKEKNPKFGKQHVLFGLMKHKPVFSQNKTGFTKHGKK
jgi:hypothetical protein